MSAGCDDDVSPELALVDPELRKRLILQEAAAEASLPLLGAGGGRDDVRHEDAAARSRARMALPLAATVLIAVGVAVTVVRMHDRAVHRAAGRPPAASVSPRTNAAPVTSAKAARRPPRTSGREFAWAPVKSADAYEVEILRNGTIVFSATTTASHIHVPARWRRHGRALTLATGLYHWYVWPVARHSSGNVRGPAVVATTFEIGKP